MHSGNITHPDGYELVLTIPVDDGNIGVQLSDLLQHCELEIRSVGVSVVLDRAKDQSYGRIHGRIIHDFGSTIYVFRQDRTEDNLTHFIIEIGHQQ
jgi:hypothetical protein